MSKIRYIIQKWHIKDYLRQITIVVIGIFITFMANDLIDAHYKKRQLKEVLHIVKKEIEENQVVLEEMSSFMEQEYHFYSLLTNSRFDISELPEDTLEKYHLYPFMHETLIITKDAMEVLKASNLTEQIKDKSLLIDLMKIYSSLDYLQTITQDYFKLKITYIPPLMMNSDKELFEKLNSSSRRESWELFWEDNYMRNFILTSTSTLQSILIRFREVEENIEKLQEKLNHY